MHQSLELSLLLESLLASFLLSLLILFVGLRRLTLVGTLLPATFFVLSSGSTISTSICSIALFSFLHVVEDLVQHELSHIELIGELHAVIEFLVAHCVEVKDDTIQVKD